MKLLKLLMGKTNRTFFHLIFIALLGLLAYSNTLNAPFQWDDYDFILENPTVKDLSHFADSSRLRGLKTHGGSDLYSLLKNRYIGYLSFALNYKLHGLDVRGYHIFNIAVHILNAMLLYFLVVLTFRSLFLSESNLKEHSRYIALFSSLLFVSHPIQTEAVTYIFQRLASLAALFYLLSLVFYIKWRLKSPPFNSPLTKGGQRGVAIQKPYKWIPASAGMTKALSAIALYLMSLLSAALAMKTKENAFTLPIVIALYEFFFFRGPLKKRIIYLIPILLTMLIIPLTLIGIDKPIGEMIGGLDEAAKGYEKISRWDYLLTEFRVIVTYIRLLFLPINQNIVYDYPIFNSFIEPQVFLSFLFLLSIFSLSVYLFYRSKKSPALRLVSFGILWFFITLSVESSIIPLPMVINEYRVYLPSVWVFPAISICVFLFLLKLEDRRILKIAALILILILPALLYMTYARNAIWGDKITLWEDVVKKSPQKEMAHIELGFAYQEKGMTNEAVNHYQAALKINPYSVRAHSNLGAVYYGEGLTGKAISELEVALMINPASAAAHNNLGLAYKSKGLLDEAIGHYQIALKLKPFFAEAYGNLGVVYEDKGQTDTAIEYYKTALKLKPTLVDVHMRLGNIYFIRGLMDEAINQYLIAVEIQPNNAQLNNNLGALYLKKGLADIAEQYLQKAERIKKR